MEVEAAIQELLVVSASIHAVVVRTALAAVSWAAVAPVTAQLLMMDKEQMTPEV